MTDQPILRRINELAREEEELWRKAADGGGLDPGAGQRLDAIVVESDQCYDLLRQRQARRAVGQDPDEAELRPPDVVEQYQQ
jgi:hypothetical protein